MRTEEEIERLHDSTYKEMESMLGMKIRNGQAVEGIRKALRWVLK